VTLNSPVSAFFFAPLHAAIATAAASSRIFFAVCMDPPSSSSKRD
jgi:hypothetical protein